MNIKYTSDGKKVVVVGKLNATESIVQEIFIQNGGEIPSGEQFVAKALHDAPAESWKETRIKDIAAKLDALELKFRRVNDEFYKAQKDAGIRVRALKVAASAATQSALQDLEDFVSGKITHVVMERYNEFVISEFDSEIMKREEYDRDYVKLLSLFGQSDGSLQWRVHDYSDHSGSVKAIIPARGYDEAVAICQGIFDSRTVQWRTGIVSCPYRPNCAKNGRTAIKLNVPNDVIEYFSKQEREEKEKRIATLESELAKLKQK